MRAKEENGWPVTDNDIRPAGPADACTYCGAPRGQYHKLSCVTRERTVVVDATIRLVRRVPESWSPDEIEYGMNHARWCATNILNELDRLAAHAENTDSGCLCEFFAGHYVREATAEDENKFGVRVKREQRTLETTHEQTAT